MFAALLCKRNISRWLATGNAACQSGGVFAAGGISSQRVNLLDAEDLGSSPVQFKSPRGTLGTLSAFNLFRKSGPCTLATLLVTPEGANPALDGKHN